MPLPDRQDRLTPSERFVVRLLRRWAACRLLDVPPLPELVALSDAAGATGCTAVAVGSLLQLFEACLGRPLEPECCCSPQLSPDEQLLIHLLATAPADSMRPCGLSGALRWAATAARRQLAEERQFFWLPTRSGAKIKPWHANAPQRWNGNAA